MLNPKAILYYSLHPVEFVEDIIQAQPDPKQIDILQSLVTETMTTVRSGHGIGKSAVEAWAAIWFLCTRPFPKIPCTAPTQHQLFDILWAEISKWLRNNPLLSAEIEWTKEKIYMRKYPEEWFAVARTASKPDALQGFHAEHVLYIIDEASGVDDKIFEPVLGALSTPGARLLMCGNPTQLSGFFYDSHHKNRSSYRTFHIDSRNCPRVSQAFIDKIIDMYGEDSDVFRVRVSGDFPKALPDSLISLQWVEQASEAEPFEIEQVRRVDIGVDVARYGGDSSVLTPVLDRRQEEPPEELHHNDVTEVSGNVVQLIYRYARRHPYAVIHVKIDCDGLGVGVYDIIREQAQDIVTTIEAERMEAAGITQIRGEAPESYPPFELEIVECHFGASGGTIDADDPIAYSNSTGVMWGTVREALRRGELRLVNNDKQTSQLTTRRYRVSKKGELELERKEEMKKRGLSSPDFGDALALAMYNPVLSDWSLD